ncbi:G-protein coupled receptor GRL101-like [Macrosteles quadrilineatus]|uniref:G-protein coupled receptor GRL101-like n=1 Tax=Macrosteles quadrilineatus TaxID=74068 RepID=UPI0023E2AEAD|nr:G-protein coupled receptor GRL101-like [Macrosteles quadrilineatus]
MCAWFPMAMLHVLGVVVFVLPVITSISTTYILDEHLSCSANQTTAEVFQCESVCLPPTSVCNGIPECPSGQDEAVQQCGCLNNEFRCSNSCVALVKRCDRHADCDNEEDELDCKSFICPITHFKCNNHFCVPLHSVCDFTDDCGDNSDEIDCPHRPCWHMEFTCNNGKCIRPMSLCDGRNDCLDGSDEDDCTPDAFVRCGDGSLVHRYQWCDDHSDCEDNHADEINCRACDERTEFRCSNGRCVRKANICDAQCDCGPVNNSSYFCEDERDCHPFYTITEGVTICKLGKSLGCSVPESAHTSAKERCIRKEFLCDGHNDCYNGNFLSDEFGCDIPNDVQQMTESFRCKDSRTLPDYLRCDFKYDCLDGDDEHDCPFTECREGEWSCSNGQCIPYNSYCDLTLDCMDKTDEINCSSKVCREGYVKCQVGGQCLAQQFNSLFYIRRLEGMQGRLRQVLGSKVCREGCVKCQARRYAGKATSSARWVGSVSLNSLTPSFTSTGSKARRYAGKAASSARWVGSVLLNSLTPCFTLPGSKVCREGYVKCQVGGQCLAQQFWCDYFIDCPDGSDESNCSTRLCGPDQFTCDSGQCVDARLRCYDSGSPRDGCADGSHLKHCREWECVEQNQFKCRGGPCLNISLLCDHAIDCKGSWNDEDGCPFTCSASTPQCECRDIHINCTDRHLVSVPTDTEKEITWFHLGSNQLNETLNNDTFVQFERILYLDLSNNSLRALPPLMFRNQWRLSVLDLHDNLITYLSNGSFYGLASLKALHLQGNKLQAIQAYAFYGLYSIISLDLQGQEIHSIEPEAFIGLHSLAGLDLSHNKITLLSHGTLRGMPSLLFLNLSENWIKEIEPNVFRSVPLLDKLVTDEFRFCCLARNTSSVCLPPPDEFSSCEDLMSNLVLRLCVWLLAGVATVGNVLVIVWRTRYSHCNQVHSFLITNLALGDLIMGCYLLLIALVDWYYRGVYFIHDSTWRSSKLCALAGFLSTFSSELSVFTLTVITLDRFLVIIFPFRVRRLEMARTRRLMALGWSMAAVLSALPLSHIPYFHNFYGRSGVCLALHITPDKPSGWEYSVFVFLFLNLASFSVIAVGYLWMFVAARTTQLAVARDRRSTESAMAWRMTLLVATDAACWVPIIGLGLASLAGFTMPPQVFAWVAVFVLPLNAAINPVLYTISTAPFLSQGRRGIFRSWKSQQNSSNIPTRQYISGFADSPKSDNSTCYSLIKRTSVRWHQKVDTAVCEHGEVITLSQLD